MAPKIYGGRWQRLGSLSEGGQGFVYRVTDLTGVNVGEWALKRLKKIDRVDRFAREITLLRKHPHENIIKLIDAQVKPDGTGDENYLVMPIAKHGDLSGRLPIYTHHLGSVIEVVLQIANALAPIHKVGGVHRDIKPGNVLFPEAGHKVWLADFGLGFDPDDTWKSPVGEVVGPRGFTAPELETGTPDQATPSADIYSLGRLIFFMLSGGRHIAREDVLDPRYDDVFASGERHTDLRLLLNRMVALQSRRIQDITEVVAELKRLEKWEEHAVSLVVGKSNLSTIDQMKRQAAEAIAVRADNIATRKTEEAIVAGTTGAIQSWLSSELEKLSTHIKSEGAITSSVVSPPFLDQKRPFGVQTGSSTGATCRGGTGLKMRLEDDPFEVAYTISFLVGNETAVRISFGKEQTRSPAVDPLMIVIPVVTQSQPKDQNTIQYRAYIAGQPIRYGEPIAPVRRTPGPTDSNPPVYLHQSFLENAMSIFRFKASQWPACQSDFAKFMDENFGKFLAHIRSPYHAFNP